MSEQITKKAEEMIQRRADILSITPAGEDALIYWHTVAQDAINSAQKERERVKVVSAERDALKRDYERLTNNLVDAAADRRTRPNKNPLDLTRLISMACAGRLDLNVSLYISQHNTDTGRREINWDDETDDE